MKRVLKSGFLVLTFLTVSEAPALASKTVIKAKGADAGASFDLEQPQTCGDGSTATLSTRVGVDMLETTTTTQGVPVTVLQASVRVVRTDTCDFSVSFGSGLFQGVGSLQMTALRSAKVTGHFVLDNGTVLDLNLDITGSDTTSVGANTRRSLLGKVMVIQRSFGVSRTATVAGTGAVDGHPFTTSQMTSPQAMLARNTGGDITIIKP